MTIKPKIKQWTRIITFTGDDAWIKECRELSWITGCTIRNLGTNTIAHSETLTSLETKEDNSK